MVTGKAIFQTLSTDDAVRGIVGTRIYPDQAPEPGSAYPKIVYAGDTEVDEQAYDGPTGLTTQTIGVACMGLTYADASGLADAVKNAIAGDGEKPGMTGAVGGIRVQGAFLEDRNETTESDDDLGPNSTVHVHAVQFSVIFNQNP